MRNLLHLAALTPLALTGCSSTPEPLPPGKGLVTSDRSVPEGETVYTAPLWSIGDRFVFDRGGFVRLPFRVAEVVDGTYRLVEEESGLVIIYGADLSERGQYDPDEPELARVYDPADYVLSWPLWVGKRWVSEFVSRGHGRPDVPLIASYHCDSMETLTTPAGTFECLRIWRRARVAAEGDFMERVSILWYAPEAGLIVCRLGDGLLTELEELHRQE